EALARLWEREAALAGLALLVECPDRDADQAKLGVVRGLAEQVSGALIVAGTERLDGVDRPSVVLEVARLTAAEQRAIWRAALGATAAQLNGQLDQIAAQFSLGPSAIGAAVRQVGDDPGSDLGAALWDACRSQARPRLDDLAQRIESAAAWDDLVLPEAQLEMLRGVLAHVRQRATVYERWGFARRGGRGLGITALFAGPSGTGKTLAAEVLANELRLDLYRVDLSQVVSKYIGETEKNLRRVFDAAEGGGAVLLFDEADALFGKRSEVKDSHDRYANVEVSYLLQRMEAYRGLALLTTNMKQAIDAAFLRRIRFVVTFPFPDTAQRAEIWRRVFPPGVPTAGLSAEKLACLSLAGGNIANIALGAAVLAADAGAPVGMAHVLAAARAEYAKLDRTLTEAETAGWLAEQQIVEKTP
ncbi:MAG TPA: ATP-binding protein, partial [Kouleothrix sp.]|nr:ATP-binding protein [Kouleothrix sp.]